MTAWGERGVAGGATKRWLIRKAFNAVEWLGFPAPAVNRLLIDRVVRSIRSRPHAFSSFGNYTSWSSLTDLTWSARHLPAKPADNLPPVDDLIALFERPKGQPARLCGKSTCLFPAFAQYLTDGFIRTLSSGLDERIHGRQMPDAERFRRTTSNHQIDLCQLYGRTPAHTAALRLQSETSGQRGRLKSQMIDGEEYAPFLFENGAIREEFEVLDDPLGVHGFSEEDGNRIKPMVFAFGGDRANSVPQTAMISTLLLREHNRLAAAIERENPDWDDRRVFETARNVMIVVFIKIVVEEYINHISPQDFTIRADPKVAWNAPWNKPNWITTEFSLLYRWHGLIPDQIGWGGKSVPVGDTFLNNGPLLKGGLKAAFADISATPATRLGLFNTNERLLDVEKSSIMQGRACDLATYSDYRQYLGMGRPARFEDITSDKKAAAILKKAYGSVDNVEFFVGLFIENRAVNSPLPPLILRFVAIDAFSQALTNPLLSEHVFKQEARAFSKVGWQTIQETATLRDMLARNIPGDIGDTFVGMTLPGWTYA